MTLRILSTPGRSVEVSNAIHKLVPPPPVVSSQPKTPQTQPKRRVIVGFTEEQLARRNEPCQR